MNTSLRLERFICELFYQAIYKRAAEAGAAGLTVLKIETEFKKFLDGGDGQGTDLCYYNEIRRCLARYASEQPANYVVRLDRFTSVLRKHGAKLTVVDVAKELAKQVALRTQLQEARYVESEVEVIHAKVRRTYVVDHYIVVKKGTPGHLFFSPGSEPKVIPLADAKKQLGNIFHMLMATPYLAREFRLGHIHGRTIRQPEAVKLLIK